MIPTTSHSIPTQRTALESTLMKAIRITSATLVLALAAACHDDDLTPPGPSAGASGSPPDVAVAWFDTLYDALQAESISPPAAARIIGYAGVAAYEATIDQIEPRRSLGEQLNGLGELPEIDDDLQYHWQSIVNSALATTLTGLFQGASAPTLQAFADLELSFETQFAGTGSSSTFQRSIAQGEDVAMEILDWAATDGFTTWNNCAYTPPTGPGAWVPTPPNFSAPLQPCWGNLRPFVLIFATECPVLPPPTFSTAVGSAFYLEALEVYNTVNNLTQAQLDIAQFWADSPGTTGTPPGHWISIVGQVVVQEELNLAEAAEAYARVGIAVNDSFISCWEVKYFHNLLRPITYIQDPLGPINDPAWMTAGGIATPPFPEYTSGHSVQSGAAAFVLTDFLGDVSFTDDTHAGTFPARSFSSFNEAADEAALSRLYAGIHFRSAIERGIDQGRCIGSIIVSNVDFED